MSNLVHKPLAPYQTCRLIMAMIRTYIIPHEFYGNPLSNVIVEEQY